MITTDALKRELDVAWINKDWHLKKSKQNQAAVSRGLLFSMTFSLEYDYDHDYHNTLEESL